MTVVEAVLLAVVVVLLGVVGWELRARRRDRRADASEVAKLRKAQSGQKAQITEIQGALGITGEGETPDVVGEMRVIRGLLKKLTDRASVAREAVAEDGISRAPAAALAGDLTEEEILDVTRLGLEHNRVDLYLQPIVTLPQRRTRFYEAFSRIRTEEGSVILPEQYVDIAASAGLLTTIDNLLLFRCIQLIRKSRRSKLETGFFCNLSGASLADPEFFDQFVEFLEKNPELPEMLMFELSQAEAGQVELVPILAKLRRLGFAFSLDKVDLVTVDFDDIARRGFRYVKIEAAQLLSADVQSRMTIHMADLGEILKRAGVKLIVEKVEEESQVLGLLEMDIDLAQGHLFGEPRPIQGTV